AYYVMDFIEGCTLSELVKRRMEERKGPLPEKEALRYIRMVGEALDYLHAHSMNHFDVKPANILVRKADDRPILIDFGLSKQYDESSKEATATVMGMSRGYAPMEQYVAGGVKGFSPQTDLYSLAATLYYLLAGYAPPDAPSLAEQELIFPAQIPGRLIEPISKAMSSRRLDRQESVRAFLDDLETPSAHPKPQPQPMEEATEIVFPQKRDAEPVKASLQATPAEAPAKPESTQEEAAVETGDSPKRMSNWIWFAAAACIGLAVCLIVGSGWLSGPEAPQTDGTETSAPAVQSVEGLIWESPLGKCVYSGEVITDAETGEQIPDGKGVAKILGGEYGGCTYDGEFKKGVFEGKTVYTLTNGDTFEGTFVNNEYSVGKYTDKESGVYFEGTFKNGVPDVGTTYDRNGNITE
ncbi:MAG: protein kinase, partial [Muribaculaceae bacterium]|nr:protein kinase [Muribaculaceae bacterium]